MAVLHSWVHGMVQRDGRSCRAKKGLHLLAHIGEAPSSEAFPTPSAILSSATACLQGCLCFFALLLVLLFWLLLLLLSLSLLLLLLPLFAAAAVDDVTTCIATFMR